MDSEVLSPTSPALQPGHVGDLAAEVEAFWAAASEAAADLDAARAREAALGAAMDDQARELEALKELSTRQAEVLASMEGGTDEKRHEQGAAESEPTTASVPRGSLDAEVQALAAVETKLAAKNELLETLKHEMSALAESLAGNTQLERGLPR